MKIISFINLKLNYEVSNSKGQQRFIKIEITTKYKDLIFEEKELKFREFFDRDKSDEEKITRV